MERKDNNTLNYWEHETEAMCKNAEMFMSTGKESKVPAENPENQSALQKKREDEARAMHKYVDALMNK